MKCKRCSYCWLPCGNREIKDRLYMVDLGICPICRNATSRVRVATPGDVAAAMLWGESRFECLKIVEDTP